MLAVVFEVEVRGAEREVGVELWFIRCSMDYLAGWRGFSSDDRNRRRLETGLRCLHMGPFKGSWCH